MRKLVIVHKPMFKKPFCIERHYFNDNILYKKDVLCGYEFVSKQDAEVSLQKLIKESSNA